MKATYVSVHAFLTLQVFFSRQNKKDVHTASCTCHAVATYTNANVNNAVAVLNYNSEVVNGIVEKKDRRAATLEAVKANALAATTYNSTVPTLTRDLIHTSL